ncbi:MAG: hypothetical protein WHX53_04060 [Anaerolineae bacterium]
MKRILLCGNSIPLAGLAARLRAQPNLMVVQADLADLAEPPGPDDLVIVEADRSVEALALLRRHPIWRLLSVDTVTGALTAFSSRSYSAQSVEDVLVHVLEDQA